MHVQSNIVYNFALFQGDSTNRQLCESLKGIRILEFNKNKMKCRMMILVMYTGIPSVIIGNCYGKRNFTMNTSEKNNCSKASFTPESTFSSTSILVTTTAMCTPPPNTSPTTFPTISPTSPTTSPATYTIKIHWALVVIGGVIVAILLIAVITCTVFTGLAAKGVKVLIQYLSDSARANGEYDIQIQQQQPQEEGIHISLCILLLITCL